MQHKINLEDFKIQRIIIEGRHRDIFTVPDLKYKFLSQFQHEFPLYNTENPESFTFIDPKRQLTMTISIKKFDFSYEPLDGGVDIYGIASFYKDIVSIVHRINKISKIEALNRIGTRIFFIQHFENQQQVENIIFKKFLNTEFGNTLSHFDEVSSPHARFSARKGNTKMNIGFSHQEEQRIEAQGNRNTVTKVNDSLLIDYDIFRDSNLSVKNLSSFTDQIVPMIQILNNFLIKSEGVVNV